MDTRKHIVDLEAFREMLHISPWFLGQSFAELPFEEEILEFLRDDILFSTIKVVLRHQNTEQYGAILPIELTTEDIRNTKAYKDYYACATGEAAPKPKASARKKKGGSASSTTPPTPIATPTPTTTVVAALRLSAAAKDDDDDDQHEAENVNDDDDDEEEISKIDEQEATKSGEGDDEEAESDRENSKDDGNGEEDQGLRISEEERIHEEEEADELYRDVDINQGRGLKISQDIEDSHVTLTLTYSDGQQESSLTSSFVTNLLNLIIDLGMESIFTTGSSTVAPIPSPKSTMTPSIMTTTTTASHPPIPLTPIPSDVLQTLPTFALIFRFEDRVKSLEVNFLQFMRTNQSTEATDQLQDSIQRENDEFLRTIDDNMKKIIKEQVKSQVKAQVTRILPRIEEFVNAQLEAEVLTRSSHSLRTSYAVAADLSKMELKKILIDKIEGNKSIQRSDEQHNLYKALVEAYNANKTILDTYGESAILKRRREEDDDQEGPFAGSDRRSTTGTQSRQLSTSEFAFVEEPVQTTCQMEEPSHPVFETGAKDQPIVQTSQHPEWFS
nr:hypothetical protein [Tanacetum cinerariifolium]